MKEIRLFSGQLVQVSEEDFDYLNQWVWNLVGEGYAGRTHYTGNTKETIFLHKIVFSRMYPQLFPELVDHIDRCKLNCVRSNLRECDRQQNNSNCSLYSTNSTGYKGVYFNANNRKYHARIMYCRKRIHLGYFDNADQAALAYNNAAKRLFKEFASLNIIPGTN